MLFHAVSCNGRRHKVHNFRPSHSLSTWEELKRRGPTPWFCLNIGYPKIQIWLWLIWSYLIFSVHCSTFTISGPKFAVASEPSAEKCMNAGVDVPGIGARRCAGTTGDCSTTAHLTGVQSRGSMPMALFENGVSNFHGLMDNHHSPWLTHGFWGIPFSHDFPTVHSFNLVKHVEKSWKPWAHLKGLVLKQHQ